MASIYKDFWINRAESRLQVGKNNSAYVTGLSFKRGDTVQMDVCLVEQDGTNYANVPFASTATIKAAIGVVDTAPTSGYFVVSYGGVESGSINYDATATSIQTTLNAVSTISSAGGVTVSIVGNQYRITFNNVGARSTLEWVSDTFLPPATTRITVLDAGSATSRSVQVIKLVSQPFSFTDVFTDIPDATASLSVVTAWADGKSIYNVSWSPTAIAGSVAFTVDGVTKQIPFDASEASWTTAGYTAIKAGINSFDVTILTTGAPSVSVSDTTLYGRKGLRGIIGLNTAELEAYFTSNEAINAYLEIEVLDSGVKDTAVQQSVTIFPDIINGSETVPTPLSVCATEAQFNALSADVAVAEGNALAAQAASANALILAQNLEIDVQALETQMPSSDVRDALATANAPSTSNPFATMADVGGGGGGGGIADAPSDGKEYVRKDATWVHSSNSVAFYDDAVTYILGDKVVYDNKFYWMSSFVGAAGYNPVANPSYWTEISPTGIPADAPQDSLRYERQNATWVPTLLTAGDYYFLFVDHIDKYGSYVHIHRNGSSGGGNFPVGFTLWFTEQLTGSNVGDFSSYYDQDGNVAYAATNYGNYIEVNFYSSSVTSIRYSNSRLY